VKLKGNIRAILAGGALGFACLAHAGPWPPAGPSHLLCCGTPTEGPQHNREYQLNDQAPAPAEAVKPAPPLPAPLPGPSLAALEGRLETISGYAKIAYSQLAGFKFQPPPQPVPAGQIPPDVLAQVPAAIRRLDGRKVVLTGYMLPLKLENGFATEFFLLSSPSLCCYGITPEVNEWMHVRMRKEGLPAVQDVPIFLAGRLRVRARWNDGYLTGIYEMEGDGLLKPKS
jgi:hypothetical protein